MNWSICHLIFLSVKSMYKWKRWRIARRKFVMKSRTKVVKARILQIESLFHFRVVRFIFTLDVSFYDEVVLLETDFFQGLWSFQRWDISSGYLSNKSVIGLNTDENEAVTKLRTSWKPSAPIKRNSTASRSLSMNLLDKTRPSGRRNRSWQLLKVSLISCYDRSDLPLLYQQQAPVEDCLQLAVVSEDFLSLPFRSSDALALP